MISGLPESTLRYYEQIGIIDPIARDPSSGHRAYSDDDLEALTTVSCLAATGMPLDAMREYLRNRFDGPEGARRQVELLDAQSLRLAAKAESIRMQQAYVSFKTLYWRAIAEGRTARTPTGCSRKTTISWRRSNGCRTPARRRPERPAGTTAGDGNRPGRTHGRIEESDAKETSCSRN